MIANTDLKTTALKTVSAAVAEGAFPRAFEAATAALQSGYQHPTFYNARALWFQEQGRFPEALAEFEKALRLTPNDIVLLNAIGLCYVRCNKIEDGVAALDHALKLAPNAAVIHFRKGWAQASGGDRRAAHKSYERAIELNPEFTEALAALASLDARDGKIEQARGYAERCLAKDKTEPTALSALAMIEIDAGNFAEAERILRRALEDKRAIGHIRAVLLGFLGDALDGQNKTAEAFDAYSAKAQELRDVHAARMAAMPLQTKLLGSLAAYIESTPTERWKISSPRPVDHAPRVHVFLLGFMRSGTTLLEQALTRNPDVVNLEERPSLQSLAEQFMSVPRGLDGLRELDGNALDRARAHYWQAVRGFGVAPEAKVFVDKQPLNTINLPLIAKLFPEAKILFAIRDPRDVVFSCFRRHFEINATTYEFLDLESAARLYAAVMKVGVLSRERFALDLHEYRYEDMIADFEASLRGVCDFLGISFAHDMSELGTRVAREDIRSPSAAQITQPLYQSAIGEWRRYASAFVGAMPILKPWIERFGYVPD